MIIKLNIYLILSAYDIQSTFWGKTEFQKHLSLNYFNAKLFPMPWSSLS